MMDMDNADMARRIFASDRYATEVTGIVIDGVGEHASCCTLKVDDRHRNARGVVMGGALYTLADFAAAVAANTDCLADGVLHWVSLDSTAHFLSPATGSRLCANCTALKTGRSTALYQTEIKDVDSGKLVAIVDVTMIKL